MWLLLRVTGGRPGVGRGLVLAVLRRFVLRVLRCLRVLRSVRILRALRLRTLRLGRIRLLALARLRWVTLPLRLSLRRVRLARLRHWWWQQWGLRLRWLELLRLLLR